MDSRPGDDRRTFGRRTLGRTDDRRILGRRNLGRTDDRWTFVRRTLGQPTDTWSTDSRPNEHFPEGHYAERV